MDVDAMISPSAIHIVRPAELGRGTAQTPGSERRAAITPTLGIASAIWGGLFEVEPGSQTGIHHHGEQETIAYVLSGICEIRWGVGSDSHLTRRPIFVPSVGNYRQGMLVSVPLHLDTLPGKPDGEDLHAALAKRYAGSAYVSVM